MGKNKKQKAQSKRQRRSNKRASNSNKGVVRLMPDNVNYSLRYTSRSQISGTSFSVYNFDATTLHVLQPTYRDQLLAIWQQYVVLGVTIDTKIVNKSTTIDAEVLEYHGDGYTISGLTFNQALEYKHCTRRLCSVSGNTKSLSFSSTIWLSKYLPKNYMNDSRFWGTSTAGPSYSTDRGYQHAIGFIGADPTQTISVMMDRRITFHVKFFTLASITNSLAFGGEDLEESYKPVFCGTEPVAEDPEKTDDIVVVKKSKNLPTTSTANANKSTKINPKYL